jgi:hypothetical protein
MPGALTNLKTGGVKLALLVAATILFAVAAFGLGPKLGFDLVDLGLACFAASFIV